MSLPDLLTAYANIIADEIVNECVDDIDADSFRVLRYHGHAIPDDIGCENRLSVWWENIRPKAQGPCPLFPVVILNAKYVMCWKQADVTTKAVTVHYTQNDADAARLATIAECVTRRLFTLVCLQPNQIDPDADPFAYAFAALADSPAYLDTAPGGPLGGVAWVNWRIQTSIYNVPTAVPPLGQIFGRSADDTLGVA